jgi:hypothetical protein
VIPGYVRLAVDIEHFDDIIADIEQALAAANACPLNFPCQKMGRDNGCSPYFHRVTRLVKKSEFHLQ